MRRRVMLSLVGVLWASVALSQEAPAPTAGSPPGGAPPTCEAQIQDHYRKLTTEGLVTSTTAPQWGPQLTTIVTKVRTGRNQYELRKQQAEFYEQNILELAEQLRAAREQVTTLQTELEKLRPKPSAPPVN